MRRDINYINKVWSGAIFRLLPKLHRNKRAKDWCSLDKTTKLNFLRKILWNPLLPEVRIRDWNPNDTDHSQFRNSLFGPGLKFQISLFGIGLWDWNSRLWDLDSGSELRISRSEFWKIGIWDRDSGLKAIYFDRDAECRPWL